MCTVCEETAKTVRPVRQDDQKQTHHLTRQISKTRVLTQCNIVQITHHDFGLDCFVRLPTRLLPIIASFFGFSCIYISQDSVATQLMCGKVFNNHPIANCL